MRFKIDFTSPNIYGKSIVLIQFFIICRIAQKIHRNLPEKTLTLEEYPNLDMNGKDSVKVNPALELIKAVCKVTLRALSMYQK